MYYIMPKCKNNPSRSYKGTEPSPKGLGYCASGEKIGKKRKGKDGNMWIVKEVKSGSGRWVKFSTNISKKDDNKKVDKKIDCSKYRYYLVPIPKKLWTNTNHIKGSYTILEGLKTRNGYIRKYVNFNTFEEKETKIPKNAKLDSRVKSFVKDYRCNTTKNTITKNNEEYKK